MLVISVDVLEVWYMTDTCSLSGEKKGRTKGRQDKMLQKEKKI